MVTGRSSNSRKQGESMRPAAYVITGMFIGFFFGVSFHTLIGDPACLITNVPTSNTKYGNKVSLEQKHNFTSDNGAVNSSQGQMKNSISINGTKNVTQGQNKNSTSDNGEKKNAEKGKTKNSNSENDGNKVTQEQKTSTTRLWVPKNPRGAESLPPNIVEAETDYYLRRLFGEPSEDLTIKPKYLMAFTVGYAQKYNIDAAVKKLSSNFSIILFHYDGQTTEWNEFEWATRAIHVSVPKQTKWWYAKRFLHPDVVGKYDYIFLWDEDLGVDSFNGEQYLELVRKHGLEISQPGVEAWGRPLTWRMTQRLTNSDVHKQTEELPGRCPDPHAPPCAAFVEIMAPVFSRKAWRCVWYLIQNDLVHGWGLDFALQKCVEPAHEKIGVVDAQWIVHQGVPSLGSRGEKGETEAPWVGVRRRCEKEWKMFQHRVEDAEKAHYKSLGIELPNSTVAHGIDVMIPPKKDLVNPLKDLVIPPKTDLVTPPKTDLVTPPKTDLTVPPVKRP